MRPPYALPWKVRWLSWVPRPVASLIGSGQRFMALALSICKDRAEKNELTELHHSYRYSNGEVFKFTIGNGISHHASQSVTTMDEHDLTKSMQPDDCLHAFSELN